MLGGGDELVGGGKDKDASNSGGGAGGQRSGIIGPLNLADQQVGKLPEQLKDPFPEFLWTNFADRKIPAKDSPTGATLDLKKPWLELQKIIRDALTMILNNECLDRLPEGIASLLRQALQDTTWSVTDRPIYNKNTGREILAWTELDNRTGKPVIALSISLMSDTQLLMNTIFHELCHAAGYNELEAEIFASACLSLRDGVTTHVDDEDWAASKDGSIFGDNRLKQSHGCPYCTEGRDCPSCFETDNIFYNTLTGESWIRDRNKTPIKYRPFTYVDKLYWDLIRKKWGIKR